MNMQTDRIAVVGGGLVGLVSALALADTLRLRGGEILLLAPSPEKPDKRTTAMLMPAVRMLRDLGAWGHLSDASAPLRTMRIVDVSGRILTAPPIDFKSSEIEEEAFGYNVPNDQAVELLRGALSERDNVTTIDSHAGSLDAETEMLITEDGSKIQAGLFVAADGRDSQMREDAGIGCRDWSYPQTAAVTTFAHTLPHGGVSTELHTRTGPFTQVPLPPTADSKYRSSLVWVVSPPEAEALLNADPDVLARRIEDRLQSSLGKVTVEDSPQAFPLSGMTAHRYAAKRVVLVGEAAHVIPPIGAQGFNLGVSDISTLVELVSKSVPFDRICTQYNLRRVAEVSVKTSAVDILNRSLLSSFLPFQLGRSLSLGVLSSSSLLRRLLMKVVMEGPAGLFNRGTDQPATSRS